jgi:hypothetical protein
LTCTTKNNKEGDVMQKTKNFLMLIGIISAFFFGAIITKTVSFEQKVEAQTIQSKQWETMVIRGTNLPESLQGPINIRGEEGWELVTVLQTKEGNFVAFLKRRK